MHSPDERTLLEQLRVRDGRLDVRERAVVVHCRHVASPVLHVHIQRIVARVHEPAGEPPVHWSHGAATRASSTCSE